MMNKLINNKGKVKLENKTSEDYELLSNLDDIFLKKRGYIAKMPSKGDSVVACLSSGQDSVSNIGILLQEFQLNVYPFFIDRGQSNYRYEKASTEYFNNFYKKKHPDLYHDYLEIKVMTPAAEYKDLLRKAKKTVTSIPLRNNISYPARNPIIFLTGMEYGYSLLAKGIKIHTIFAAHVSSDGSYHCSQTWTRLTNLQMCQILNDWSWQFISIPIETAFGNYYDKDVFIKWSYENDIPLYKARTCVKDFEFQCGDCPPCWDRRRFYKELGIKDPTKYLFDMSKKFPTYYDHEEEEKMLKSKNKK